MIDFKIIVSSAIGALVALVIYGMLIKSRVEHLEMTEDADTE